MKRLNSSTIRTHLLVHSNTCWICVSVNAAVLNEIDGHLSAHPPASAVAHYPPRHWRFPGCCHSHVWQLEWRKRLKTYWQFCYHDSWLRNYLFSLLTAKYFTSGWFLRKNKGGQDMSTAVFTVALKHSNDLHNVEAFPVVHYWPLLANQPGCDFSHTETCVQSSFN